MSRPSIKAYYDRNLREHGVTAQGVGWKNKEAQYIRFEQLIKVIWDGLPFSLNDLGCGTGDLFQFMKSRFDSFTYRGYDVLPEMICLAEAQYPGTKVFFQTIDKTEDMQPADYTMASGIFNLRFEASETAWKEYILQTVEVMNDKSTKGFAFNALTSYSDAAYMERDLYYTDPAWLFDYCKKNFSKNVALLHDYCQYDFTMLVKKNC